MPTGCCGMAGSFGFEAAKYQWSRKIAEHALLPRLEGAAPDALVLANGFSCREQIEGLAGRSTRHLAEIIAEGMGFAPWQPPKTAALGDMLLAAGGAVAGGLLAAALYRAARGASSKAAIPATTPSPTAIATAG
jgi:hypothetical protein